MADGDRAASIEWFSAAALAGKPGMPTTERGVRKMAERGGWTARRRTKGKGFEYPLTSLPAATQAALLLSRRPVAVAIGTQPKRLGKTSVSEAQLHDAWTRYEAAPQHIKDVAARRLQALQAVERLVGEGHSPLEARKAVASQLARENVRGASVASLYRWASDVSGVEKQHRMAMLLPEYAGRTATVDIPAEAWDFFKTDYLRVEAPSATSCYERLQRVAKVKGWAIPHLRTFMRRIERELPRGVLIMARQGREAFDRTFPAQERDRSVFHALEAVNADGHKFDVFVRWPDGTIARPILVGVQDLYSGKILGYRVAETESSDLVRLAFRDAIERYGIPSKVWLDNGRAFASKYITGGVANRFRFKVKQEDPLGILTTLVDEIHWTTPYHGQAKPIERAWRDMCDYIAKHPEFAGAYTGNKPDAKPENYGSKAVPLDTFVRVLNTEIVAHNAREGRRSRICDGKYSFDQVFNHSYAQSQIRKATDAQLREMLLAAEVVKADAFDGSVKLSGNRYWSEQLAAHAGKKVMLRFDPDALHTSVQVYTLANVYLGEAECAAAVGFADTQAARDHARAKTQHRNATKKQLEAERRMDLATLVQQLPAAAPEELPPAGVVAPMFGKCRPKPESQSESLARTGTDDARVSALGDYLARTQAQQNAQFGWRAPEDDA
ncbi:transposase domain-containing protein [Pseudoxanthomonas mexicana]|uniref:transposase domain-containing protein n=1 Tax=Pseudoxanthomonas mexicana TaxID=128785 RepID=UPI00398AEE91